MRIVKPRRRRRGRRPGPAVQRHITTAAAGDTFLVSYRGEVQAWSLPDGSNGTRAVTNDNAYLGGGFVGFGTASGNYVEFNMFLAAGTYKLFALYRRGTNRGISTVAMNGSDVGTWDNYGSASSSENRTVTITDIVVSADDNYAVRLTSTTKNASSSAYAQRPQTLLLTRTGS